MRNDRTTGETAGKCYDGAMSFVQKCGIPVENVHGIGKGVEPEAAAERYEAL